MTVPTLTDLALSLARTESPVLITGENGTGKEVLAHFIHDASKRAKQPFVVINCAAIPESMLEKTLFGYEHDDFADAIQAIPGKFEQAQHGTLLFDQISEMNLNLQAKLLPVLQTSKIKRLRGKESITFDVRIMATSNCDLQKAISAGNFREDLYCFLNVSPLYWQPLCYRKDDIIPIADYLITKNKHLWKSVLPILTQEAKNCLIAYDWPGNAHELDNVIQRALILQKGKTISENDIYLHSNDMHHLSAIAGGSIFKADKRQATLDHNLKKYEYSLILRCFQQCRGDRRKMANMLGITPQTLRAKLARMRENGILI